MDARTQVDPEVLVSFPLCRFAVSAVIPTKNRKDQLRQTIYSALSQTVRCEVIVIDDGSTDGTEKMVRNEFPAVIYEKREVSGGPTACRNRGAEIATGEFLVTLDDDCVFCESTSLEKALEWFDLPEIAAVTLPFVNVKQDNVLRTAAPARDQRYATLDFYGGMVVFRRDRFLAVGGYRTSYFMHWEEYDLAVRLLQAGFLIRNGEIEAVHHYESAVRDAKKLWRLGGRNGILFAIYNVPLPFVPFHLAATIAKTYLYAVKRGAGREALTGIRDGLLDSFPGWRQRRPLAPKIYNLARRMKREGPQSLSQIKRLLSNA
ncbi:MAG TPA: glycosyltransferase family A protein [Chthoniobacterales bacterium]|nr:glycosyltransferase family A protein [Chthoniobacterales bacterium]